MPAATSTEKVCIHCGTRFRATAHRPDFCCAGCEFVHGLIQKKGLTQFYELQDGTTFPVRSVVFQHRDYSWLDELIRDDRGTLELDLQGISCIGCVWLIEKLFDAKPGALAIRVDPTLGRLHLRWEPGRFDVVAFAKEIQSFGYLVGPVAGAGKRANRSLVVRLGLCAALAMNAMLFTLPGYLGMAPGFELAGLFAKLAFACSTLSFLVGGSYFFGRTWHSLRLGVLHVDLPISLGLIAAYAGSLVAWRSGSADFLYFDFISVFTFLMLAGRWTQEVAVAANRNRLLDHQFTVAHPDRGERFRVAPGQVVPVKSKLLSAAATLGMEWISGESESRTARLGQLVPGGAVNLSREPLELEAAEPWHESMLARLLDATPRTERRARGLEKFIRIYLSSVLVIALSAFASWMWRGAGALAALQVVTSILVVSCPCATGVALPLAEDLATARARRAGVLVRDPGIWSRLPRVNTIVFDKTGTLTLETIALLNPDALERLDPGERSVLLAMVEDNLHPVASCLRENLLAASVAPNRCESGADFHSAPGMWAGGTGQLRPDCPRPNTNRPNTRVREVVGCGIEAEHERSAYRLGRPGWARDRSVGLQTCAEPDCVFTRDGEVLAAFRFGDELREDAAAEFQTLAATGRSLHILSGDRAEKVAAIAASLGLTPAQAHGGLSPDDKAAWLRAYNPLRTLMLGDGANDSLAFNESLCTGTPAIDRGLLERRADFYFLGRGLAGIRALFDIALRKRAAARAVIAFAIAYNLAAIAISISGKMSPLLAAILMPLSGLATIAIVLGMLRR